MRYRSFYLFLITTFFIAFQGQAQTNQDIRFVSDSLVLKGTITMPSGKGPFPGLVFIHGSGPNDRNQRIVLNNTRSQCLYPGLHGDTLQNFKSLADTLAHHGVASLRYDKQTLTYREELDLAKVNPGDFIRDANAALDYLKKQDKVKSDELLLFGHSQGGSFLPIIANNRADIKGLVASATPAQSIDTVLANQVKRMVQKCDDSTRAILQYEKVMQAFEQLRKDKWPANKPLMNAYPDFWRDWIAMTDTTVQAFQQINPPTLFLAGGKDYNVPAWQMALFQEKVDRPNVQTTMLEGVNHFLTPMDESSLSTQVSKALIDWLREEGFVNP